MPSLGSVRLHDSVDPALDSGSYRIVTQSDTRDAGRALGENDQRLEIVGPRFALEPGDVLARRPAADAVGGFGEDIPYVVLSRRTLPWERRGLGATSPANTPWLALLVLAQSECDVRDNVPIADVVGAARAPRFGAAPPVRSVTVKSPRTLQQLLPRVAELPLLCHVREVNLADTALAMADDDGWFAIVSANRVPLGTPDPGTPYVACLVSLEERDDILAGTPATQSLVVLDLWRFTSTTTGGTFRHLIRSASVDAFGAEAPVASGHVILGATDRRGVTRTAAYRGPLIGRTGGRDGTLQLAGDFMARGHDQALFINRDGVGPRVQIADFASGELGYVENWGASTLLGGWHDQGDLQLAGDFMGLGHDQVLFINRTAQGGRVLVADFNVAGPPATVRYWENWGDSTLLNGWHDSDDLHLVGDFMGRGHDQVLFINRSRQGGRVLIADFNVAGPPATVRYWENWDQTTLLDGWHDDGDVQLVGDFAALGPDQVMFTNRFPQGGRVLIADFKVARPPATVRYRENWGDSSLLDGWHDVGDLQFAGDFMELGHDQVMFINRSPQGGRVLIADFNVPGPGAAVRYWENWGESTRLDGWHEDGSLQLTGDFTGSGRDQVMFIAPDRAAQVLVADFMAADRDRAGAAPPGTYAPDRSLDVAREVGRLLAAADGRFLREMIAWRRRDGLAAAERGSGEALATPIAAGDATGALAERGRRDSLPAVAAVAALTRVLGRSPRRADAWGVPAAAYAQAERLAAEARRQPAETRPGGGAHDPLEELRRERDRLVAEETS